jgi:hypothetical protein
VNSSSNAAIARIAPDLFPAILMVIRVDERREPVTCSLGRSLMVVGGRAICLPQMPDK